VAREHGYSERELEERLGFYGGFGDGTAEGAEAASRDVTGEEVER